jgi:hypothetical protein
MDKQAVLPDTSPVQPSTSSDATSTAAPVTSSYAGRFQREVDALPEFVFDKNTF